MMFEEQYAILSTNAPFPVRPQLQTVDGTKLTTFLDCPRQYFFTYVLGWRSDRPNNHLVFGSAWHEAMEHMLLNGYSPDSVADAYELFITYYRAHFPEETDELFKPKTPTNAMRALLEYSMTYARDDFTTLHTEIAGRIAVGEDRSLVFRMDSICENRDGSLFSLEHKTKGSAFNRQWHDQWTMAFQVGTYSHVLHCLSLGRPLKGVVINGVAFAAKKIDFVRIPVYRSPAHMQNWLFHANHYLDRMEQEMDELLRCCESPGDVLTAFPQNPQSCTKYFGCPFFDYCAAWSNPLEHASEPPLGFIIDHWDPLAQPAKLEVTV